MSRRIGPLLLALAALLGLWVGVPLLWLRLDNSLATLVTVRFASLATLLWFGLAWLVTGSLLVCLGWWMHGLVWHRWPESTLPRLVREQIGEGIVLCDWQGQSLWLNEAGQRWLCQDGRLRPEAVALVERVRKGQRLARQSLTVREGVRVAVQALPLPDRRVALLARPPAGDTAQSSFYESFIRRIVHDMRNPLAAIIAHAGNIQSAPSADVASWQQATRVIELEAQRLTRLVDSILFDARLAYVPLATETVDLADVLEDVLFQYDERATREGKTIELDVPSAAAPVTVDRDLIVRALGNLVDNSLKYSRSGGLVRLELTSWPEQHVLKVIDTGDGIPPEYLPDRVFEPLVRARPKDEGSGSGFGLSIVRKIVELHGGSIAAESVVGQGTTMTLCLPR